MGTRWEMAANARLSANLVSRFNICLIKLSAQYGQHNSLIVQYVGSVVKRAFTSPTAKCPKFKFVVSLCHRRNRSRAGGLMHFSA